MLELNKLYNMDCMEGMKTFPDKYFDLAIVDPQYGMGWTWKNPGRLSVSNHKKKDWNNKIPSAKYFDELFRVSQNQIIWGGNYFTDHLPAVRGWIVWKKFTEKSVYSDIELCWTSFDRVAKLFEYRWNGMLQGNIGNKKLNEIRIHPTQKPVQLYKWILHNYVKPDFKIIDTHAGSCSSVIAFLDYGCDWIAFEIDKDYYMDAGKRIELHKQQLKLNYEMEK